jgi:hypothetical protein
MWILHCAVVREARRLRVDSANRRSFFRTQLPSRTPKRDDVLRRTRPLWHSGTAPGAFDVMRKLLADALQPKAMVDALQEQKVGARSIEKAIRNTSKLFNWATDREPVSCVNPARRVKVTYTSKSDLYREDEVARLARRSRQEGARPLSDRGLRLLRGLSARRDSSRDLERR